MRRLIAAVAALGVGAFGAGAASAQIADPTDQDSPMYCVYTALTDSYDLIAEAFLYDDVSAADIETAKDILSDAADTCADENDLSDTQRAAASDIGIYGSVADYLAEELFFEDVPDEAVDGIYDVLGDLSDDDLDTIIETNWLQDESLVDQVKEALIEKGIPDDDYAMESAMKILEVSALATDRVMTFMLDDLDLEEDDS